MSEQADHLNVKIIGSRNEIIEAIKTRHYEYNWIIYNLGEMIRAYYMILLMLIIVFLVGGVLVMILDVLI